MELLLSTSMLMPIMWKFLFSAKGDVKSQISNSAKDGTGILLRGLNFQRIIKKVLF